MQYLNDNWQLALIPHSQLEKSVFPTTFSKAKDISKNIIPASVPGNFELDMLKAGLIEDPYYGINVLSTRKLENLHLYYSCSFELNKQEDKDTFLVFEGIDTVAEIYIDGQMIAFTENMFISHQFSLQDISNGKHELMVHIIPACIYARNFHIPATCFSLPYNFDALVVRKAPYMFGWDIMSRIVSGGIFKPCYIEQKNKTRIEDFYLATKALNPTKTTATLRYHIKFTTDLDLIDNVSYVISGKCGDSEFSKKINAFSLQNGSFIKVENAKLWMPKNYGEQNLYDINVSLFIGDKLVDTKNFKFGIRIIQLSRTSLAGENGDFCFIVNGQRVFTMGTNLVPTDAFPSRHNNYMQRQLDMIKDLNCNIVRCWGGNVYPDDDFYDYCDQNGILVWQDFALACGFYPEDQRMQNLFEQEAIAVVKKLRNHPSLALWSGDNECDTIMQEWTTLRIDGNSYPQVNPNDNMLTRTILKRVLRTEDFARPYLPSSPYVDQEAFNNPDCETAEEHLWGPRDYFKGEYYGTSKCHFASETGYHGCPSPKSLQKFIPLDHINNYGDDKECNDIYWQTRASSMEPDVKGAIYSYRISLMSQQIKRIFNSIPDNINDFAIQSQISQGEAKKYFIERFRINKGKKNGIIWWNLIDGWPQISDAVVDWYGTKKLAYHYIKNSQQSFCMMMDEPKDNKLTLFAVNDTQKTVDVCYTVKELSTNKVVLTDKISVEANLSKQIALTDEIKGGFYLIEWSGDCCGKNHFTATIGDGLDYKKYVDYISQLQIYQKREGFDI